MSPNHEDIDLRDKKPIEEAQGKLARDNSEDKTHSVGEKNSKWKGGVSTINDKIRKSKEYKEWRLSVYRKYFYTCQICGKKDKSIVAHHIKNFADYPELRFLVNNGIVLCRSCHLKVHSKIKNNKLACQSKMEKGLVKEAQGKVSDVVVAS